MQAKVPKQCMQVGQINVSIAPAKLSRPYGMQIMYTSDSNAVRNIYVCADTGEVCCHQLILVRLHTFVNLIRTSASNIDFLKHCNL